MKPNSRRSASGQSGFTLVEIMVGLAIGMLATVVIIQVISVFEAQRRTTTGSADAQTNGGIAMYTIGRELQMAGYPLVPFTNSPLECTTLSVNGVADATTPNRLTPVVVVDGVAAAGVSASDAITVRYGNAAMGGVPTLITQVGPDPAKPNVLIVRNNFGCQTGDTSLITNGGACAISSVAALPGDPLLATTSVDLSDISAAGNNAYLACLGTAWNEITYRVNDGNLERCELNAAIADGGNCDPASADAKFSASVTGIVNLQVQYGVSAVANSNQVTQWVDASGGTWGAPTVADRNRIKAVRIAVVARNAKMDPATVTNACSSITAAAPTGLCAWAGSVDSPAPTIDLSAGDANWARYRYRVFETIIPLRNMIWARETL
ncbi:MAG: PilW family protein [Sulfuricaulis sp.]|nr:PilW family protein [Sulfuricaulis sp.]